MINWKELTADSTNPGWESNPGHLFRYYTTRPPESASDTVNTVYMNRYQNTNIIYMETFHYKIIENYF